MSLSSPRWSAFAATRPLSEAELRLAPLRYPRPSRLRAPLQIKPARAARAAVTLGLETVGDLLEHLPHRHEDRREARAVASLRIGEEATVIVDVRAIRTRPTRRRNMSLVEARVSDRSGHVDAVWFNQPWIERRLASGSRVVLHGRLGQRNRFTVREYELTDAAETPLTDAADPPLAADAAEPALAADAAEPALAADAAELALAAEPPLTAAPNLAAELALAAASLRSTGLVPVYPASEGISPLKLRDLVWEHRDRLADVIEPLPGRLRAAAALPDRPAALTAVHFPELPDDADAGRRRLAFEELLLAQLNWLVRRAQREGVGAAALGGPRTITERWLQEALPFPLTADQRAAIEAIDADLAEPIPMQRLLMGEVGSGKTVVALHAMLRAVEHDLQAALMAPTETLAEQHFATLQALMPGALVPCALLTGSTPAGRRADTLGKLASGELKLVVGTHAIIEQGVDFAALGVAVVDEQHRFGVRQRAVLDAKAPAGSAPHVLHMTATPIPRTLALANYGDLDITVLRELPRGRQPIATHVVAGERERARAYERIREELRAGRQAFVVCPLVEESDALAARAATVEYERLARTELAGFAVVLMHGQMAARDKQAAMAAFMSGAADVLVATSVIEVGIDVPNASVMLVEGAERYGISQLHQLRGRVGRGPHRSLCLLVGPKGSPRLRALAEHTDGFRLAQIDLELRGEGEIIGTRQSGLAQFRHARLPQDAALQEDAKHRARDLLAADPGLGGPEHALLVQALLAAYGPAALAPLPA